MAELQVRITDKTNKDSPYLDAKCFKRGDVIAICEDGHKWGAGERDNGEYIIVKMPGVPVEKLELLYMDEEAGNPKVNRLLQKRGAAFDIDAYLGGAKAITEADATALKKQKPALEDPNVFSPLEDEGK